MDFIYLSDLEKRLKSLITEGYQLFSSYRFGSEVGVCTYCCLMDKHLKSLQSLPVKKLERETIYNYLDSAEVDTIVLIPQVKHILPRVLELLIQGEYIRHSNEIALDKLHIHDYRTLWLDKEIDFLNRFALAFFEHKMLKIDDDIESYLLMFHLAGLDIQPLLQKWFELMDNEIALLNFAKFVKYEFQYGTYRQTAFADHEFQTLINDWLQQSAIKETIYQYLLNQFEKAQAKADLMEVALENL